MSISDSEVDELMSDSQTQQQSLLQPLHASTSSAAGARPSKSPRSSASSSSSEEDEWDIEAAEDTARYAQDQAALALETAQGGKKKKKPRAKPPTNVEKLELRRTLCLLLGEFA